MPDDKTPDDPEMLDPDVAPDPPPQQAKRASRREDDDYDRDDRDDDYHHPSGRKVHYDEDGYEITSEQSMWALFAHIGVFVVGFIAPLVILIIYNRKSSFVARHARESLNHQISLTLLVFLCMAVAVAIGFGVYAATQQPPAGLIVGYVLFLLSTVAVGIFNMVTLILATIAAAKYQNYRYPFTIRLIG